MQPCHHCFTKYKGVANPEYREDGRRWLDDNMAMNPLSRREKTYVCCDCGKAEALADMREVGVILLSFRSSGIA